jgi:hypothetical protein
MDSPTNGKAAPLAKDGSPRNTGHHDQAKSLKANGVKGKAFDERQINAAAHKLACNASLTPEQLAARAERWRSLYEAHERNPEYRLTLSFDDQAELFAAINDMGAEAHYGVPLWERIKPPPTAHKANGKAAAATPTPQREAKPERSTDTSIGAGMVTRARLAEWYEQVANDVELGNLTHLAYFIAVHIGRCADNETGFAFPGEDGLAKRANCNVRSVRRAVAKLQQHGHMRRALRAKLAGYELILKQPKGTN